MEKKVLNNIKDVFNSYKCEKCDQKFAQKIIDEANKDSLLNGYLAFEFDEHTKSDLYVPVDSTTIICNYERYIKAFRKYIDEWLEQFPTSEIEIYNFLFLHFILHEIEHVKQNIYALYLKSEYPAINELYRKLANGFKNTNLLHDLNYYLNGVYYSFERSANIYSYDEMIYISESHVQKEMGKVGYLFALLNGYIKKKNKIITPVADTYRWIGIKENIPSSINIPFYERIVHGLDITEDEYDIYSHLVETEKFYTKDYELVKDKIRKLESK